MAAVARPLAVSVMPLENRREQFLTLATLGERLGRMRQVVSQVRALLRGERVPLAVAKEARALRLNVPPAEVPICLAAIGDASVRLAGEVADGWMPFLYPVRVLGQGLERLRAGAVPPEAEVLLDELIVYGTPAEARRRLARWYEAGAAMPGLMFRPNLTAEETRRSLEAFVPMLE